MRSRFVGEGLEGTVSKPKATPGSVAPGGKARARDPPGGRTLGAVDFRAKAHAWFLFALVGRQVRALDDTLVNVARTAGDPIEAASAAKAASIIRALGLALSAARAGCPQTLDAIEAAARKTVALVDPADESGPTKAIRGRPAIASAYRSSGRGQPNDIEALYSALIDVVNAARYLNWGPEQIVREVLVHIHAQTAGLNAPGPDDERFGGAVELALSGVQGLKKKSTDPGAVVRACFRAIGVKMRLGMREKQRRFREKN